MPRELVRAVPFLQLQICVMARVEPLAVCLAQRTHRGRDANGQAARRDHHPLGHQGPGTDDRAGADDGAVQHDGSDADETAVLHARAMHHGPMPNRDPRPDGAWHPGIAVQHRAILHVAAVADADPVRIGAHDRSGPDAHVTAEHDVAKDHGGVVDERQ